MTLKDLKSAAESRRQVQETEDQDKPRSLVQAAPSDRTKMLGARVSIAVHREFQTQLFRAQEEHPDLNMQIAIPAMIRLLRDETVWRKFMAELKKD